ncbi:MAG: VOC family protein, partial [Phycicoccus sp.]
MGILRLSHVEVRCPDLELSTAYYTEVVGLVETATEEGAVYLKGWDEHQHHSLVLRYAPTYGVELVGFKVQDAADLDELAAAVEGYGLATKRFEAGELGPGSGATVRFTAPSGHVTELVHGMEQVGNALPLHNPPPEPQGL